MNEELKEWYNTVPYEEIKNIIRDRMSVMAREYVGIGFYLRRVRDNEMYLEDGYKDVHEFAAAEFGMSRSTVNHCMRINEQFSVGGNSPTIDNRYKDFSKSQLQEMLYLPDDKLDEVTPDMTIKEIRGLKADRLDVEPETDDQIPGRMTIEDYPEYLPGDKSDQKHNEPVSVLGYPMRVYPEGSLIATPGCGKQDCFSCHRGGCELRQEDCYCVEAPMGNPFPCTTLNVVENLRQDIGNRCQFVNEDLAFHRAGDGQPVPCCKQCENPCGYECRRSVEKRHTDVLDEESNKTKPKNQEKSSCPPDVHSCIREEWGTNPEQQHEGAKECAKCWSEWKKRQEVLGTADKTVVESDESVIKPDEIVIEPDDSVVDSDFPEEEKSEDEQIPEPDENWNIGDLQKAPERYLKALAKVLVDAKGIQMVLLSPGKYLSDESIEKRIKALDKENGGCIHLGNGVIAYASHEIIEFFEGETDLGVCSYKRFATQARKAIDSWNPGQDAAENTDNHEMCCENSSELEDATYSEIAIRDYLEEEENTLAEYERVNGVEKLPLNLMIRQRMLVKALKLLLENEKEVEKPEDIEEDDIPEQPELPVLKNNDQRKAFLDDYQTWPVWFEVPEASEVYHRFDLPDGSSIVICKYRLYYDWKEKYTDESPHGIATREYLLKPGYHYLHDCLSNRTALVEHLKEAQKK